MRAGLLAVYMANLPGLRRLFIRARRFVLVGGLLTAYAYAAFTGLVGAGVHFMAANTAVWASGVGFGFVLNRRYTFGVRGREGAARQFALFAVGSLAQLGLSSAGYVLLIGRFDLQPGLAFILNVGAVTVLMFGYLNFIAFQNRNGSTRSVRASAA